MKSCKGQAPDAWLRRLNDCTLPLELSSNGIGDFHTARRVPPRGVVSKQIIDAILPLGDDVTPNAVEVYISTTAS